MTAMNDGLGLDGAKFIVWTDFDGTITLQDSNDYLTDNLGFGEAKRKELNKEVLYDRMTFRDSFQEMIDSVSEREPFEKCKQVLLDNIKLDPGFKAFHDWTLANQIPLVVLSSGMEPIIRGILEKLVGENARHIPIVSNNVARHNGSWNIVFHDDSHFGHDKSLAIKPYRDIPKEQRPTMVYCGDGVSDLSAARETDLLFAKEGRDLVEYCKRENVPYTEFHSFADIHKKVQAIFEGKLAIETVAENR